MSKQISILTYLSQIKLKYASINDYCICLYEQPLIWKIPLSQSGQRALRCRMHYPDFEHLCKQYCGKKFYHSYFEHFYKMNRQNKKIKEETEKIKAKTEDIRDHSYIT